MEREEIGTRMPHRQAVPDTDTSKAKSYNSGKNMCWLSNCQVKTVSEAGVLLAQGRNLSVDESRRNLYIYRFR